MAIPEFNELGDLPEGVHKATLSEVLERFRCGSYAREKTTETLLRVYRLVAATGKMERFVIFGSYVSAKTEPRDVDIVLVMSNDFAMTLCDDQTRLLFDHHRSEDEIGRQYFLDLPERPFSWHP